MKTKNILKKLNILIKNPLSRGLFKFFKSTTLLLSDKPTKWGLIIVALFFGTFGIWACFAPIDSAAVAQGIIKLDSNTKIIQHLEGGIIEKIAVKEGDVVQENQVLIMLSKTAAQANLELLSNQLRATVANEIRLLHELKNKIDIKFDDELLEDTNNPEIKKVIDTQQNLFLSRTQTFNCRIDILNNQIKQLQEQILGISSQKISTIDQLKLINSEKQVVKQLLETGNETQPRLMALERHEIELKGNIGEFTASLARAKQAINQVKLELINLGNDRQQEISTQLNETQISANDLKKHIIAAKDVLKRLIITAPKSGIITELKIHTKGGVIPPGAEIMKIIPQDDELIIEARLNPQDIDVVHVGLTAKMRLLAYKSRYTPMLTGKIIHVSPDQYIDPMRGIPYYLIRVRADNMKDSNTFVFKKRTLDLYPGMPVEVLVVTGSRTFFEYLLDPIKKTFRRAFRED